MENKSKNKEISIVPFFTSWLKKNRKRFNHEPVIVEKKDDSIYLRYRGIIPNIRPVVFSSGIHIDIDNNEYEDCFDRIKGFTMPVHKLGPKQYCCKWCLENDKKRPEIYESARETAINHCFEDFLEWSNKHIRAENYLPMEKLKLTGGSSIASIRTKDQLNNLKSKYLVRLYSLRDYFYEDSFGYYSDPEQMSRYRDDKEDNSNMRYFSSWLKKNNHRFNYPLKITKRGRYFIELRFTGIIPDIRIVLWPDSTDVVIYYSTDREYFDMLVSYDFGVQRLGPKQYCCECCMEDRPGEYEVYASPQELVFEHNYEFILDWANRYIKDTNYLLMHGKPGSWNGASIKPKRRPNKIVDENLVMAASLVEFKR